MYEEGNNAYCFSVLIIAALYVLYCFNYIPHKKYTNADFNIEAYKSNIDKDNDGIDDQTDILNNANNYIKTNPKYKSKYYNTGYPNDEYGVCTDVVAFALKDAGYDLMVLVNEDIKNNKELYEVELPIELPSLKLNLIYLKGELTKVDKKFIKEYLKNI